MPTKVFDAFTRLDASDVNAYLANKSISNAVINGGFDIWQRGTTFTNPGSSANVYTADRWVLGFADANPTSASISRQAFTPGAAPEVGYEAPFFARSTITTVGSTTIYRPFGQRIENVRTFANQTVTLSFWAKADSARTVNFFFTQVFGSGGSSSVSSSLTPFSLTSSWQRFTHTFTPPSISGKTIGASSYLEIAFQQAAASGSVLDLWGVQLEAGTVANDFRRNANSQQGELAACQRYYEKSYDSSVVPGTNTDVGVQMIGNYPPSNDLSPFPVNFTVEKRAAPTVVLYRANGTINRVDIVDTGGVTSVDTVARLVGTKGFRGWLATGTTGSPSANRTAFHYTASAEL